MKKSKDEINKEIDEFFSDIKSKTPKQIKKMKKLAMHNNLQLKEKRKKFCKKCYSTNLKIIGVKKGIKRIKCNDCEFIGRWKVN